MRTERSTGGPAVRDPVHRCVLAPQCPPTVSKAAKKAAQKHSAKDASNRSLANATRMAQDTGITIRQARSLNPCRAIKATRLAQTH